VKTVTAAHRDTPLAPLERIRLARKAGRFDDCRQIIADEAKRQGVFGNLGKMPADLLYEYALLMAAMEQYQAAHDALFLVAGMVPKEPKVWRSLGLAQEILGDFRGAFIAYKTGVDACNETRYEDESRLWIGYGAAMFRMGRASEGEEAWRKSLRKPASSAEAIYQRAQIKFALGRYTEDAWQDYEARKDLSGYTDGLSARGGVPNLPEWDGKSEGRVLCVMSQGAGDVIQFSRYLDFVDQCSRVTPIMLCGEPLKRFIPFGQPLMPNMEDYCQFVMHVDSAPLLLGLSTPIPPAKLPFPNLDREWHWRRPQNAKPRVGVCWKGSPKHLNDKDRSCPFDFRPALQDERWELVSLTNGHDFAPKDYQETAELMRTLDAVVTVDTSIVHVAGTLGVPTICMVPSSPEWRWGLRGGVSVWYPSVQMLRRRDVYAWTEVLGRAKDQLARML
jgi:hypothetical protein